MRTLVPRVPRPFAGRGSLLALSSVSSSPPAHSLPRLPNCHCPKHCLLFRQSQVHIHTKTFIYHKANMEAGNLGDLRGNHSISAQNKETRNTRLRHFAMIVSVRSEESRVRGLLASCMEAFDCLPLAAVVDGRFFCVHGGLSPSVSSLADIEGIQRHSEPPGEGPMCDLLWADPVPGFGGPLGPDGELFQPNTARGWSVYNSYEAVVSFLERTGLEGVVRAHKAQAMGFSLHRKGPAHLGGRPSVITLFSAPNYRDAQRNKAAVIKFDVGEMTILQFHASPHPYCLPNFKNAFSWSLPFAVDKVMEMLGRVLAVCDEEELAKSNDEAFEEGLRNAALVFRRPQPQ